MSELKHCPICGSEVFSRISVSENKDEFFGVTLNHRFELLIKCSKCGIEKKKIFELCDTNFANMVEAIDSAIEDWNRRTNDAD